jgi:hypothetical protein
MVAVIWAGPRGLIQTPYLLIMMLGIDLQLHACYAMEQKCSMNSKGFLVLLIRVEISV